MAGKKEKDIRKSAEQIVKSFTEATRILPEQKEMYYGLDSTNIMRPDGEPSSRKSRENFSRRFRKIMPSSDKEGNLRVEVAEWTE